MPRGPASSSRFTWRNRKTARSISIGTSRRIRLRTGGWIDIDRTAGRAVFAVPEALSAEELVHPFLAPVAAVAAHWHGRESLHGGGFALGDRAWGIIGDRMGGKSSLLAALAQHDRSPSSRTTFSSSRASTCSPGRAPSICVAMRPGSSRSARTSAWPVLASAGGSGCPRSTAPDDSAAGSSRSGRTPTSSCASRRRRRSFASCATARRTYRPKPRRLRSVERAAGLGAAAPSAPGTAWSVPWRVCWARSRESESLVARQARSTAGASTGLPRRLPIVSVARRHPRSRGRLRGRPNSQRTSGSPLPRACPRTQPSMCASRGPVGNRSPKSCTSASERLVKRRARGREASELTKLGASSGCWMLASQSLARVSRLRCASFR